jgi:hypothetical protein
MTLRVLDPRLEPDDDAPQLAPALPALRGAVIGLLDNNKVGAARYLDHLEAILRQRYGVRDVIRGRKSDASRPAPPEVLRALSAADAIVSAVGD